MNKAYVLISRTEVAIVKGAFYDLSSPKALLFSSSDVEVIEIEATENSVYVVLLDGYYYSVHSNCNLANESINNKDRMKVLRLPIL